MTVKELIKELLECDMDDRVLLENREQIYEKLLIEKSFPDYGITTLWLSGE